jgi:hypothetical protein
MAAMDDKKEPGEEPEVVVGSDEAYSIYTNKEKWLIVALVALAGFYRYVGTREVFGLLLTEITVLYLPISTSRLYRLSQKHFTDQSTTSTRL